MNVLIKHGTTNITSYVISYQREANICTGIGTLELVLSKTYSSAISPHNTIDIHENGDFKVRYYVSDVDRNAPEGTIRLHCQDKSKYLVDYFIPDSYTVDYPSYTRYWIEKFFTEAGITYEFTTDSQGNLLSNYTSLGLQPAYDQIMMLCQLSGWYFYFDGNGKAIIGSLTTDISSAGSVNKTDILNIKVTTDDKMLRNRAVVWGQFDPLRKEFAYADVSTHTTWNYDHRDVRTMVISNNNIPNKSSAYSIANVLIKEFARATITKELTLDGARNYTLGEMLRVSSDVWGGRGLITTFGVTMDRNGLVTNVVLDERCPRLFGFFDFGDYVYVGTFGDGVWRKHIKFDPTWYNFSTGLTSLEITDLHINNGVFGSVSSSGQMYYALFELPWIELPFSGLLSSQEDTTTSGGAFTIYSGLHARAVIVDKETNTVKYGVDNYSGLNYGDYFLSYSGWMGLLPIPTSSGIIPSGAMVTSSGHRGWIVEYDVFNGDTIGIPYPITYSGSYDYTVIDLENDGLNDYVSVKTGGGSLITGTPGSWNFGYHASQPSHLTEDLNSMVSYSLTNDYDQPGESIYGTAVTGGNNGAGVICSFFHNEASNTEREVVWYETVSGVRRLKRTLVQKVAGSWTTTTLSSPTITDQNPHCIIKLATNSYRYFYQRPGTNGAGELLHINYYYKTWDTVANTISAETLITTLIVNDDTNVDSAYKSVTSGTASYIGGKIYHIANMYVKSNFGDSFSSRNTENYVKMHVVTIDTATATGSVTSTKISFETSVRGSLAGPGWETRQLIGSNASDALLFQNDTTAAWGMYIYEGKWEGGGAPTLNRCWLIYSWDMIAFHKILVEELDASQVVGSALASGSSSHGEFQQTSNRYVNWFVNTTTNKGYVYNGLTVALVSPSSIPFQWTFANIWAMFGRYDYYYIAKNPADSKWYWVQPSTLELVSEITFPANYTPTKPFSTSSSYDTTYYIQCTNTDTGKIEFLHYSLTGYKGISIKPYSIPSFGQAKGFITGNFFVDYNALGTLRWLYVDNQDFPNGSTKFQVLRRDGYEFTLIEEEAYPIRVDISNNSPVLTVGSGETSFHSHFVYDTEMLTAVPVPTLGGFQVNDYRYALLQTYSGMATISGFPTSKQVLAATASGIYTADAETYSGGFILMSAIPSGIAGRIETTNYTYPGQFIFVTTSGINPMFYQQDNDDLAFTAYSGLPDSRATIIRIDDYL